MMMMSMMYMSHPHLPFQRRRCRNSTENTKLKLPDIYDWITDFTVACGRRDEAAYSLLTSSDWPLHSMQLADRALLSTRASPCSVYIVIDACLNADGPNVVLLKSELRKAECADRQGILFSGRWTCSRRSLRLSPTALSARSS